MANIPGKSTRQMANRRCLIRVVLALAAICLLLLIARNGLETTTVIGLGSCLLAMFGLDRLVNPLLDKLISRACHALSLRIVCTK